MSFQYHLSAYFKLMIKPHIKRLILLYALPLIFGLAAIVTFFHPPREVFPPSQEPVCGAVNTRTGQPDNARCETAPIYTLAIISTIGFFAVIIIEIALTRRSKKTSGSVRK